MLVGYLVVGLSVQAQHRLAQFLLHHGCSLLVEEVNPRLSVECQPSYLPRRDAHPRTSQHVVLLVRRDALRVHVVEQAVLIISLGKHLHTVLHAVPILQCRPVPIVAALPVLQSKVTVLLRLAIEALQPQVGSQRILFRQVKLIGHQPVHVAVTAASQMHITLLPALPHFLRLIVAQRLGSISLQCRLLRGILHRVVLRLHLHGLGLHLHLLCVGGHRSHLVRHLHRVVQLRRGSQRNEK